MTVFPSTSLQNFSSFPQIQRSLFLLYFSLTHHELSLTFLCFFSSYRSKANRLFSKTPRSPMGCFLACFGDSKTQRRRKSEQRVLQRSPGNPSQRRRRPANRVLPREQTKICYEPLQPNVSLNQGNVETLALDQGKVENPDLNQGNVENPGLDQGIVAKPESPIATIRDGLEEQLSSGTRKKVTFDLNVKTYEQVVTQEIEDYEEEGSQEEEKGAKQSKSDSVSEDSSITNSVGSYPSNHRYRNCSNSDDEYEVESDYDEDEDEDDYLDEDYDEDGGDDGIIAEVESSESFFSLPVDSQTRTPSAEKEVNSPMPASERLARTRDRSQYVHSVLNPVENLCQWKAVKVKPPSPLKHQKENLSFEQEPQIPFSSEPTFKSSIFSYNKDLDQNEPKKPELAMDASLSTWLGSAESTPSVKTVSKTSFGMDSADGSKSQRSSPSLEDRPILGALTVEELKRFSATSSPRKSPSRSPDEMPILGTVGRYWHHTGQATDSSSSSSCKGIPNTTSKYREDKRVNWHSTPFETRLERALNKGDVAESS